MWPGLYVYLPHTKRTRILVNSNELVLVTKGWLSNGKWSLPGGGLHKGEPSPVGALRELREETGVALDANALRFVGAYQGKRSGLSLRFPYDLYRVSLSSSVELHAQPIEILAAAWIPRTSLSRANASPDVMNALAQFL
jgi:8-oxo-dGTP pyrophosphatase MutT (NUDIX family)